MEVKQILRAASGWLELGMPGDALEELSGLSHEDGESKKALELRLRAQMMKGDWKDGGQTALKLCEMMPDESEFFLNGAYCLHEAGDTRGAMECLRGGPAVLEEIALFHYNMACYYCVLGDLGAAERSLERAFEMDESFIDLAKEDRDLVGMMLV